MLLRGVPRSVRRVRIVKGGCADSDRFPAAETY
jgi:hypothetical protein